MVNYYFWVKIRLAEVNREDAILPTELQCWATYVPPEAFFVVFATFLSASSFAT